MGRPDGGERRTGRRIEASALSAFAPSVVVAPFCVAALAAAWWPLSFVVDVRFSHVLIGFAVLGLGLFLKPVQVSLLTPLLGARTQTAEERRIIEPLWRELAAANGLTPRRYVVRVLPSDALNAFACGGHLVLVTSFAIEELPTPELRGVLAHELGHHLGWHTAAITVTHWLSMPVVLLARFGVFTEHVAIAAARSFGARSRAIAFVGSTSAAVLHAIAWVFTAGLRASDALGNVVGHRSEFDADQRVVRMGYGHDLSRALRAVMASHGSRRPTGWRERLGATHPPPRTRVTRIEALLRHPARPHAPITPSRRP